MYIPQVFAEARGETLHAFMEEHSFATLISQAGHEPIASHLPLLLERGAGPHGLLHGHMARANPHWQTAAGQRVLVVFHGPHAYISPSWYQAQNVVPTWNYVAVHAYGTLHLEEDRDQLRALLLQTVQRYESGRTPPWPIDSPEPAFMDRLLDAIVGFRIEIDRLEGKWKLSQNHDAERRERVVARLKATGRSGDAEVARLMGDAGGVS